MLEDALVNSVNPINTGIRSIFISIDIGVYGLLKLIYELFFSIATTEILDREMIFNVVSRVQLIIGIFMMFQLVMIIIKGIVNPDSATDSKTGGAGAIVMRIIVSLSLMALLVPINIKNPKNEYEKQIYNNGVLFGTLYSLQYRILTNNTLGKIILDNKETYYTAGSEDVGSLYKVSDRLTSTIVKAFYSLNTKKNNDTGEYEYVCDDDFIDEYNNGDISPFLVIGYGLKKCGNIFTGGRSYALKMSYLISTIVGIVMVIIMFMICFEVAKRVFQLAALQLIAPIPIISYMDPKGSKDGAFNSWVKLLTTTYLDLFTRLAVIYFSFAVITAFMDKFFGPGSLDTLVGTAVELGKGDILTAPIILPLMFIIMVIALLIFAKDAPKFFKQMLGIKDNGGGFFSTFGNAMGLATSAAGALGSFKAGKSARAKADQVNAAARAKDMIAKHNAARAEKGLAPISDKVAQRAVDRYQNMVANSPLNKAKYNAAGAINAGLGFLDGANAAFDSKGGAGAKIKAAAGAIGNRNDKVLEAGRNGGTTIGALGSLGNELITGQSEYARMEANWKKREQDIKNRQLEIKKEDDINDHYSKIIARVNSKALTSDKVECELSEKVFDDKLKDLDYDFTGQFIGGSYIHWDSQSSAAVASGAETFEYSWKDDAGNLHTRTIKTADVKQINEVMKDLASDSYLSKSVNNEGFDGEITSHVKSLLGAGVDVSEIKGDIDPTTGKYNMKFNGGGGFKDISGQKSRATTTRKDEINKESEEINRQRQGVEGQRAMYNAKRFKNGGKS